ncbi:GDSL esterase/lipase At5g45950 [Mercurialis annua]|uniref:GDSL esterase/lipase At5g45950 n=1 Tax=Mercurialis annua TaxID=3986 RepID=UPI00215EA2AE|nr:GDSL esterase/lipase At5g45950 [Mercurialis annua]
MARMLALVVVALWVLNMAMVSRALNAHEVRQLASKHNITCVLVFGDSSVDPGNNNRLPTTMKGNFPPYGKDFFDGRPTGRFSNGRLATDFIAEAIGYTKTIPAFLDPNIKPTDLLHGVSFASAASGYDDLTANISNVLPVSQQLKYLMHYKIHLGRLVGEKKANFIINNAVFIMSMGTNDFLQNYFLDPTRPDQYTVEEYENFLVSRMEDDFKEMHRLGARRLVVVGVPPMGCMPLVKTLKNEKTCVESYNQAVSSLNSKIKQTLIKLRQTLGIKDAYVDCYTMILNAVNNPKQYGLLETGIGCCGTGTVEYGDSCRGLDTCEDASKYAFWDAVHPSQKIYQLLADEALNSLSEALLR